MIQQIHLAPYPTPEDNSGPKLTQAGLSVNIKSALQQYRMGTLEEKAIGYYEQENMPIPDFEKMSKIERLVKLNEYREIVKDRTSILEGIQSEAKKREDAAILQKTIDRKVDEKLKSKSAGAP